MLSAPSIFLDRGKTMTLQELKNKIRDLGFDDDSTMAEYAEIVNHAIERACKTIALTVKAPVGCIELELSSSLGKTTTPISAGSTTNPIEIKGEMVTAQRFDVVEYDYTVQKNGTTEYHQDRFYFDGTAWQKVGKYDLAELTKDDSGNTMFDSIDRIVVDTASGIETFVNYDIEDDHILVLNPSVNDTLLVYFNERILPVGGKNEDYKVQVVYQCEPLVGLLAAHYVWLDDDERKAILYWNEYDQLKEEILAKALKPRAKVVGGLRWHN